jgi:hypothetical protein
LLELEVVVRRLAVRIPLCRLGRAVERVCRPLFWSRRRFESISGFGWCFEDVKCTG